MTSQPGAPPTGTRRLEALDRAEALGRLASVAVGRVVFTQNAMPAIRPVNHIIHDGQVIIRTHIGAAVLTTLGAVVAYEADVIDPDTRLGWSVTVTGWTRQVSEPDAINRYERLLRPWVEMSAQADQFIRIEPEIVTGYELVADPDPASGRSGTVQVTTVPPSAPAVTE